MDTWNEFEKTVDHITANGHTDVEQLTEKVKYLEGELTRSWSLLRESEQKFFMLVQNLPDIVYHLAPDGYIKFISNAVINYGYSPEELIGKNILELVHPVDKHKAEFRINERRTGDRSTKSLELRLLKKNNEYVEMEFKDRKIEENPSFHIYAAGCYDSDTDTENSTRFLGTLGVAREVTKRYDTKADEYRRAVRTDKLSGFLTICSSCKSINDTGVWKSIEQYFKDYTRAEFTHSICPDCASVIYPDFNNDKEEKKNDF